MRNKILVIIAIIIAIIVLVGFNRELFTINQRIAKEVSINGVLISSSFQTTNTGILGTFVIQPFYPANSSTIKVHTDAQTVFRGFQRDTTGKFKQISVVATQLKAGDNITVYQLPNDTAKEFSVTKFDVYK